MSLVIGSIVIEVPRNHIIKYDLNSISGSINHDVINRDITKVTSVSGSIKIHQGGKNIVIETTNGSIYVQSSFEMMTINSINGSIHILATQKSKQILTSNVSGSTKIQLKNILDYNMNCSTIYGSIKNNYKNTDY